jgi:heme A synthase
MDDIKPYIIADKGVFDSKLYRSSSHAHNVFFTYLVSGGLLIFSIFAWFWLYVIWVIIKLIIRRENEWIVLSAIGVVLVNLGIGLVNTTLHHEHAILSMYVLGLLIAQYRKSQLFKDLLE